MSRRNTRSRRRRGSGRTQLVVFAAFFFLVAAVSFAVYARITGFDDVSIGMVGEQSEADNGGSVDDAATETTVAEADESQSTTTAPSTTTTAAPTSAATAPVVTGVPLEGVLSDGRITITGSVPDTATGEAVTALIEGLVGAGNVDDSFTVAEDAAVPNSFTLQIVDNVLFEPGGDTVATASFPLLDQLVDFMIVDPNVTLVVEGHTDSTGDEVENLALSQRRAEAVRSYMAERGVNEFRLEAQGFGDSVPVDDNGTPEGRQRNRRIEFQLVGFQVPLNSDG